MLAQLSDVRETLLQYSIQLDADRAQALAAEFGQVAGSAVGIALGTPFPPYFPRSDWQRAGLAQIEREGWRVPRTREDFLQQLGLRLGESGERHEVLSAMRQVVWIELARIAIRELLPHTLGGAPISVTAREISWLAEALLEIACKEARGHAERRLGAPLAADGTLSEFVVLGMGKLGGLELNAGSDVDLCFLYDTDEGNHGSSLHEHWSRVARRIVQNIELPTDDGRVWRVDLRLRPEGSSGAIVNSMVASERYYETWGRLWERSALIRARPVAGDLELGSKFIREVASPFVYRREVDPSIAVALAELLARARVELRADSTRDLKLGNGGIREVEFFVQTLQLIWGGRDSSLRVTGTLAALERLRGAGFVTEREARLLAESYTLLRSLEHRIQWQAGIQTHQMPKSEHELDVLARSLGMKNAPMLFVELDRARSIVAEAFASLSEGHQSPKSRHVVLFTLIDQINNPTIVGDPKHGETAPLVEHLAVLAKRPDGLLGGLTRERHAHLTESLVDAIAQSADPEQAALALRRVFGRIKHPGAYFAALSEDEHAVFRLVTALASSTFIADTLVQSPDTLDILMSVGGRVENPRHIIERELRAVPSRHVGEEYERLEAVVAALRRAKIRLFVEVVIADLSGAIELRAARQVLSDFADRSLQQAALQVFDGEPRGLGILALGKLGGQDLGYGSDLDVIFLYDPAQAPSQFEAQTYFIRKAQQIIRLISAAHPAGPGYELDVRLRPSGSQGMLVTSLQAFGRYHGVARDLDQGAHPAVVSSGAPWERQMLLRARACAGDMGVAGRALELATMAAYAKGAPDVAELHRLRLRMQNELGRERSGRFDLKTGQGGLLDIEFATQWLQMVHGCDVRVRTTNTEDALLKLFEADYLPAEDYHIMRDGYGFLRQLEQRLFVIFGRGSTAFEMQSSNWPRIARRMRLQDSPRAPAAELLRTRYRDVTQAVRTSYLRILGIS
jgi:[glutamine synthetase] adenylyltransferase / [glutamine synthetase]-adenylyl-L-tyrosine phosphorylase